MGHYDRVGLVDLDTSPQHLRNFLNLLPFKHSDLLSLYTFTESDAAPVCGPDPLNCIIAHAFS